MVVGSAADVGADTVSAGGSSVGMPDCESHATPAPRITATTGAMSALLPLPAISGAPFLSTPHRTSVPDGGPIADTRLR